MRSRLSFHHRCHYFNHRMNLLLEKQNSAAGSYCVYCSFQRSSSYILQIQLMLGEMLSQRIPEKKILSEWSSDPPTRENIPPPSTYPSRPLWRFVSHIRTNSMLRYSMAILEAAFRTSFFGSWICHWRCKTGPLES